jgi:hypothetical protein
MAGDLSKHFVNVSKLIRKTQRCHSDIESIADTTLIRQPKRICLRTNANKPMYVLLLQINT